MSSLSGCRVEADGLGAIVVRGRVQVTLGSKNDFEEWKERLLLYIGGEEERLEESDSFSPLSDVAR